MRRVWRIVLGLSIVAACACNDEYVEREIGYKGRARVNPWLAAERFARKFDFNVESLAAWRAPSVEDAVWFVPGSMLNNEVFVRRAETWAGEGGHLIVLLEHASSDSNDWRLFDPELPLASSLKAMLERVGFKLDEKASDSGLETGVCKIRLGRKVFEVAAKSRITVAARKAAPGVFAWLPHGRGRVSVLTDARPLRNRWIDEHQHAEFLLALMDAGKRTGSVVFVRGSALSFWGLARAHLWPVLSGLAVLLVLWLWRNMSRFGPLEAEAAPSVLRGYDHHLEALGNFHWRLDRAVVLLASLRDQVLERSQRLRVRSGRVDDGFLQLLAARSGLPEERVARALSDSVPTDSQSLTRSAADLQILLQVLT